jgi:hypothetical protein
LPIPNLDVKFFAGASCASEKHLKRVLKKEMKNNKNSTDAIHYGCKLYCKV